MRSTANIFGHAIHPALVVIPLGVLTTAFGFDVAWYVHKDPVLPGASGYMIAVGVVTGLVAALFGLIDLLGIPRGSRAQKVALTHALSMLVTVALFAVSWVIRYRHDTWDVTTTPFILEIVAIGFGVLGGILGGELVQRFGVSVHAGEDTPIDAVERQFWG
jgi:uncharacterized membrane protein